MIEVFTKKCSIIFNKYSLSKLGLWKLINNIIKPATRNSFAGHFKNGSKCNGTALNTSHAKKKL